MKNLEVIKTDVEVVENLLAKGEVDRAYNYLYNLPAEFLDSVLAALILRLIAHLVKRPTDAQH